MKTPAITVCDENTLSRYHICENIPEVICPTRLESTFCTDCPGCCIDKEHIYLRKFYDDQEYFIPRKRYYELSFIKVAGFQLQKSLLSCQWYHKIPSKNSDEYTTTNCSSPKFIQGINQKNLPAACYTFEPSTGDSDYQFEYLDEGSILKVVLKWDPADYIMEYENMFSRNTRRAYWVSFHSPDDLSNPYYEGVKIEERYRHLLRVSQIEKVRLPLPYSSQCFDYISAWKRNGNQGPINKEECKEQCNIDEQFREYGCVASNVVHPHEWAVCFDQKTHDKNLTEGIETCQEKCRDACRETKYEAEVQILSEMDLNVTLEKYRSPSVVLLDIYFNSDRSSIQSEMPIITTEDLLSNIGGYLSLWLGWCILAVLDLLEIFFNILSYLFKLQKKRKNKIFVMTIGSNN